jgi:hypothetical protein
MSWKSTTGGAGLNREDDFTGNPNLGIKIHGNLHSNPVYLRTGLNQNADKNVFGIGIRLSFGPVPLIQQRFSYDGDLPMTQQPDIERKSPWYRKVIGIS